MLSKADMSRFSAPPRDHRIDLLRGLALVSIFINHIPGNVLEPFTHKNFGLSDAAELFVLLAGVAAAFAYLPRYASGERLATTGRAVKRAGVLYVAHLASIVVGLAIFAAGAVLFSRPSLLEEVNIGPFMADPVRGVIGLATMTHQIGYHNILPMYVCLLLLVPLMLATAMLSLRLLLAGSMLLWAAAQYLSLTVPNLLVDGGWFFNPFTWQLIFVCGFFCGARLMEGRSPVPHSRIVWWLAFAYLVAAGIFHYFNFYGTMPEIPFLPLHTQINEKPWVALPRLAHVLALAYVVGHSPLMRWIGHAGPSNPLAVMGRQGLPVFWIGTALAMVGLVLMEVREPTVAQQLGYIAAGLTLQYLVALALDRLGGRSPRDPVRNRERPPVGRTGLVAAE